MTTDPWGICRAGAPGDDGPTGGRVRRSRNARDPYTAARAFLADADLRPGFAERALARIEAQDADLGDSFLRAALDSLVTECAEEAEGLAAWAALLAARLEHDGATDRRARAFLIGATQRAAQADAMLCQVRRLVAHDGPGRVA